MATHLGARGVPGIHGIVVLGYPLRPPGKTGNERAAHLPSIKVPLLIVQGTRQRSARPTTCARRCRHHDTDNRAVEGGDHSFAVRGRKPADVLSEVAGAIVDWLQLRAPGFWARDRSSLAVQAGAVLVLLGSLVQLHWRTLARTRKLIISTNTEKPIAK